MSGIELRAELLGPAIVDRIEGENTTRLKQPARTTIDALLRGLACSPDGISPPELDNLFPAKTSDRAYHDAAGDLRRELKRVGLDLSRSPYRIIDAEGAQVRMVSDLDLLVEAESLLDDLHQSRGRRTSRDSGAVASEPIGEPFELRPSLDKLNAVVEAWRGPKTYSQRVSMLGELRSAHRSRLIDVDTRVREERAFVAVALAESSPSTSHVSLGRQAVTDFDHPDHDSDRKRLNTRLRVVSETLRENVTDKGSVTDVFLSFPMAGSGNYNDSRRLGERVVQALQKHCDVREVFWAGATIEDDGHFEEPSVGLGRNMPYFRSAARFVMLYPEKLSSGVLVEAGLALGLKMPAVYLVRDREDLPWILQDIGGAGDNALGRVRVIVYSDEDNLIEKLKSNGPHLFPAAS